MRNHSHSYENDNITVGWRVKKRGRVVDTNCTDKLIFCFSF